MAEEPRLTAAELLQYFISRYRVEEGAAETGSDPRDAAPIAQPLAATHDDDETETTRG